MKLTRENITQIEETGGVYSIFIPDGSTYIGQTQNIKSRLRQHLSKLEKRKHENIIFQELFIISDWKFLPPFEFRILEAISKNDLSGIDFEEILISKEYYWMKKVEDGLLINIQQNMKGAIEA